MKLFIANKQDFESARPDSNEFHKKAYNYLAQSVSKGFIPVQIKIEGEVFELASFRGEVYSYNFIW